MADSTLSIVKGPGMRDLEQAFIARNLGAVCFFTVYVPNFGTLEIRLRILNLSFVTCHGPNYKIGGVLVMPVKPRALGSLPPFNFIFVEYNAEEKAGTMQFTNGE